MTNDYKVILCLENRCETVCQSTDNFGEETMCAALIILVILYDSCKHTHESGGKLLCCFGGSLKIFYFFQRLEDRKSVAR